MKTSILKLSLPLLLLFSASNAQATENSWYVTANGLNAEFASNSDQGGYSVAVGKYINSNISIELGYADFGENTESVGGVDAEFEATAIQLSALGYLPVSEKAGLFARIGIEQINADSTNNTVSSDSDDTEFFYGVGGYYHVSENIDVRVEFQRHEFRGEELDTVNAGVAVKTY